jgi:hypothetical protein
MTFARLTPALLLAAVALTGCGDEAEPTANVPVPDWQPPNRYTYTLENRCGERALIGKWRIVVADGEVVDAEGLDEAGRALLDHGHAHEIPTIPEVLDEAVRAREHGADIVDVSTDDHGRPTHVDIDWDVNADDDESCFRISDYTPGS